MRRDAHVRGEGGGGGCYRVVRPGPEPLWNTPVQLQRREGKACVGACAPNCTQSEGDEMGSALAALCIDEAAAVAVHLVLTPWTKVVCTGGKHVP